LFHKLPTREHLAKPCKYIYDGEVEALSILQGKKGRSEEGKIGKRKGGGIN
jgi:hypothetical protein